MQVDKMKNSQSHNRKQGNAGEDIAAIRLRQLGVEMVETIEVGWGIIRGTTGKIIHTYPLKKVSGDFRGILPNGRSVLAEVKTTDGTLPYSQLEAHQHLALREHHEWGGLSLLVWVHDGTVSVMVYPVAGFVPRTSIKAADVVEWEGV